MSKINVWLRSKEKLFLVLICCACMIAWFIGPSLMTLVTRSPTEGGRIFGKGIPGRKVLALAKSLNVLLGSRARVNLHALAWQALILQEEAKRYGISASEVDVSAFLQGRFPAQGGAGIDEEAYRGLLQRGGISRSDFEDALRTLLTGEQVSAAVRNSACLSTDEAWLWYGRQAERVKVRYVQFGARDLAPLVAVDEEQLLAYYERHSRVAPAENRPGYLEAEKVKIEYILAPYAKYEQEATVTEEQKRAYYEANKEKEYFISSPKKNEEAVNAASDKPGDDAAAESKPTEAEAPAYRPFEEVAAEIEKKLRREEAERVVDVLMKKDVNEAIWKAYDAQRDMEIAVPVDLDAIAEQFGLVHKITQPFSGEQAPLILPGAWDLVEKAFGQGTTSIGQPSTTLSADAGKFIFQIIEIYPPASAPFEKIKKRVERDLRIERGLDLAAEIAGEARSATDLDAATRAVESRIAALMEKLPEDSRPEKKAADYFHAGESEYFERPEYWEFPRQGKTGLPGPYSYSDVARVAFTLKGAELDMAIEAEGPRAVFLLQRAGIQPASREEFETNKDRIVRELLEWKRAAVLGTWRADLRRRAQPSDEAMKSLESLPEWSG